MVSCSSRGAPSRPSASCSGADPDCARRLGVEALRRHTARESPNANRGDTTRRWREARAARRSGSARSAQPAGDDEDAEFERLAALHKSGELDDADFKAQKERILL